MNEVLKRCKSQKMNSSIITEIKKRIYHNPRATNKILETISAKHSIDIDTLVENFIEQVQVHPTVYASLIDETIIDLDEDLADYIKNKVGALKDAGVAKYTFGGTKQRALGSQEKRQRMEYLFNNWVRLSGKANVPADAQSMRIYLQALKIDPLVITQVLNKYAAFLKPAIEKGSEPVTAVNSGIEHSDVITEELATNQLRDFFNNVAEIEQQVALKRLASTVRAPKPAMTRKIQEPTVGITPQVTNPVISQQDIEHYISKLPASERADFVTKNILPKLSDADVQNIVKTLLGK